MPDSAIAARLPAIRCAAEIRRLPNSQNADNAPFRCTCAYACSREADKLKPMEAEHLAQKRNLCLNEIMMMLNCLYYPYSRPRNLSSIKRSILLFDEVAFLDSQPDYVRKQIAQEDSLDHQQSKELDDVSAAMSFGISEGVVRLVDTTPVVSEHGSILTSATVADVANDRFAATSLAEGTSVWSMLADRLPEDFVGAFYPGAGTFKESYSLQASIDNSGKISGDIERFRDFRWGNIGADEAWEKLRRFRHVIGGNPYISLPTYEVPSLAASALRINEALVVSSALGYVPFTDSPLHDRLLRIKVESAVSTDQSDQLFLHLTEAASESVLQASLSKILCERLVSEEELSQKSIPDILQYREKNRRTLARMRRAIAELSYQLAENSEGQSLEGGIERTVDTKVMGELEKAQDELLSNWSDFFGKVTIRAGSAGVAAMAVSTFAGLDLFEVVTASATAGAAMLGTKGIDDSIKLFEANRKANRNDFSFLSQF